MYSMWHKMASDTVCQEVLRQLYQNTKSTSNQNRKSLAATYGEILYPSVNKLLSVLNLTSEDIFLDLGSGLGKVVMQVFLKSDAAQALGIEYELHLHIQAQSAATTLLSRLPLTQRRLHFLHADFLSCAYQSATVVLAGSPCFSPDMLFLLAQRLEQTPTLHTVLSLRPLPMLKRFRYITTMRIECSWDSSLCYLYSSK